MYENKQGAQCVTGAMAGGSGVGLANPNMCADAPSKPTVYAHVEVRADRCFADALMAAMDGQRITRRGWNGPNQYVTSQHPDRGSKMTRPYLCLKNAQNDLVPWVPSQGDLFAHDWAVLPR